MNLPSINPIARFLEHQGVMVLDGGLATELEARGRDLSDDLWSAGVLADDPDLIRRVHADYLSAGADCIVTASYQASIPGFRKRGLSDAAAADLLRLSVRLAIEARDRFWSGGENRAGRLRPIVAASIGPYGAYLADGSEYRGRYGAAIGALEDFHRERFDILVSSGADLLACESIPDRDEAGVLLRLLHAAPDARAWFSFTCRNGTDLSDGTPIGDVAASIDREEHAIGIGINCTAPRFLPDLIASARRATSKPIVVYPNSGETWDPTRKKWSGTRSPIDFADAARAWVDGGARLVGGCCRTGPDHIRRIRARLLEECRGSTNEGGAP